MFSALPDLSLPLLRLLVPNSRIQVREVIFNFGSLLQVGLSGSECQPDPVPTGSLMTDVLIGEVGLMVSFSWSHRE